MNTNETLNQEPYIVTETPKNMTEKPHCKTLRNQFSFMWKICLVYGLCYLLFAYQNPNGIGSGIFAGISAIFLLMIARRLKNHPVEEENLSIHISAESVFYYVAATLISFGNCLSDNGFFLFFNHVGSFLLFSIASIQLFYRDKHWDFGKYTCILFEFWIQILEVIPVPFRDFGAHRRNVKQKMPDSIRYVILGILCGLPILFVTTLLLASADQVFSSVLENIIDFEELAEWFFVNFTENVFILPYCFLFYTLLLYLIFAALCKKGLSEEVKTPKKHGALIAITMFAMIDFIYVLFSGIQFVCLFIGVMPNEAYEYSEYAREGFFELLFVALINFFLVLFCNRHFAKNIALKILMTITCLCTYVMIASSAYRMWMYVDVYHLTFLRVFVLWFLAMLCFFMAGSLISIYKSNWNTFRYCLFVLTCFYTTFALSNVDEQIATYNVRQFEKDLPKVVDTVPSLDTYLPEGYEYSKAYAKVLYNLELRYGDALDTHNTDLIDDYFLSTNHYYITHSLFEWKHFNFAENNFYALCDQYKENHNWNEH